MCDWCLCLMPGSWSWSLQELLRLTWQTGGTTRSTEEVCRDGAHEQRKNAEIRFDSIKIGHYFNENCVVVVF